MLPENRRKPSLDHSAQPLVGNDKALEDKRTVTKILQMATGRVKTVLTVNLAFAATRYAAMANPVGRRANTSFCAERPKK
jgi:hypothetical protein